MVSTALRAAVVLTLALGMWGLSPAGAAFGHRAIAPTVFHDGRGSVWMTVAWVDGHPVTEQVIATISGHDEQGASFGPVALQSLSGSAPTTLTYSGTLAPGRWTTTIDIALPTAGYCAAQLTVDPAGAAQRIDCAVAAPATDTAASTGPGTVAAWAAAILVAILGLATVIRRRRRHPTARPRRPGPARFR
jgi:hypothetical protein